MRMTERYSRIVHPSKRLEEALGPLILLSCDDGCVFCRQYFWSGSHDDEPIQSSPVKSAEKPISRLWVDHDRSGPTLVFIEVGVLVSRVIRK